MVKLAGSQADAEREGAKGSVRAGAGARDAARIIVDKAVRVLTAQPSLALLDQAVVSGASFATTVMIGRFTYPSQLGLYALAGSILIWLANAQESLVSLPYTLRQGQGTAPREQEAGSALALGGLLAALAFVAIGVAGVLTGLLEDEPSLALVILALAAVAPFVILRDFSRKYAFAHFRTAQALALDCVVATFQLSTLAALAWTGTLSTATALAALGGACAVASLSWLVLARAEFRRSREPLRATLRGNWSLGKWLFANQLLAALQSQATLWLVAIAAGTIATGIYTACVSIAMLANPVILGLSNTLWAKHVRSFRTGGRSQLLRDCTNDAMLLGAVIGVFCLVLIAFADEALALLFPRGEYAAHGHVVILLAFAQLAYAVGMPASSGLSGMGHVRANFAAALAETIVMIAVVWPLAHYAGVHGAAYGVLLGCLFRTFMRWTVFVVLSKGATRDMRARESREPLDCLLPRLACGSGAWQATPLDLDGCQGRVFTARYVGGSPAQPSSELVIKLYRPDHEIDVVEISYQYQAVRYLRARLHGRTLHGWTMTMPAPVLLSQTPPALVMTRVPGRTLARWLKDPRFASPPVLDSAAAAVAESMMALWSAGLAHGDLTIENILCDWQARTLSFVDGGAKTECIGYAESGDAWRPAVHDLAHLIAHEGETLATAGLSGRNGLRRRFIEGVMRRVLMSEPHDQRRRFLDDVAICVRAHIRDAEPLFGPYGLWRAAKNRIALARTRQMIAAIDAASASWPAGDFGCQSATDGRHAVSSCCGTEKVAS